MQIKKSPRDAQFPGTPRYETNSYGVEPREEREETMSDAYPVRHRTGEQPMGAESDTTSAVARSESVIDRHSSFDGQFETEHDMRIEGSISGEVICRGLFTVDREATAKVRVTARDAHIHGRLEGDIVCSGKLQLSATAHVTGTLKAAVLVVEEGATVSGNVDTTAGAGAAARPAAATATSKNGEREPGVVKSARRDLPSFAIVTSDERASGDRN